MKQRLPEIRPETDMVRITGGTFRMGADLFYPEEAPAHQVTVDGFWIDEYAVTNAEFAAFVAATGYVTVAERPLDRGHGTRPGVGSGGARAPAPCRGGARRVAGDRGRLFGRRGRAALPERRPRRLVPRARLGRAALRDVRQAGAIASASVALLTLSYTM